MSSLLVEETYRNKKNIIYLFINEVKRNFGDAISKAILYGSYAREDYREDSDIDIMILTPLTESEIRGIEAGGYCPCRMKVRILVAQLNVPGGTSSSFLTGSVSGGFAGKGFLCGLEMETCLIVFSRKAVYNDVKGSRKICKTKSDANKRD